MAVAHDVGQPKVGDLDVHAAVQQQVLGLEVTVHHLPQHVHHTMNEEGLLWHIESLPLEAACKRASWCDARLFELEWGMEW